MTTDSQKQERKGAKDYGATVNSGSGNTTGHKNDVRQPYDPVTPSLSVEFKTTKNKGFYLRLDTLRTMEKEALLDGREGILGLEFRTSKQGAFRYVIMPEDWFLDVMVTDQDKRIDDEERKGFIARAEAAYAEQARLEREQWIDRGSSP